MDNELRAVTGTTATIGYECAFVDNTKKTVTIGSYRTADLPTTTELKNNIRGLNTDPAAIQSIFLSSSGAQFRSITGCTITVTNTNVIF